MAGTGTGSLRRKGTRPGTGKQEQELEIGTVTIAK
jgi:hypothetical protein